MKTLRTAICIFLFITFSSSFKVLIHSPAFGYSHSKFLGTIADILTQEGHDVTVLMPVYDVSLENKTALQFTKSIIKMKTSTELQNQFHLFHRTIAGNTWTSSSDPTIYLKAMKYMKGTVQLGCKELLTEDLFEQMKDMQFDVGIGEPTHACVFGLFEALNIKSRIGAQSTTHVDSISQWMGEPTAPSWVPGVASTYSDEMGFFQRIHNVIQGQLLAYMFGTLIDLETAEVQSFFGSHMSDLKDSIANVAVLFTNSNPYLDFVRPTLPRTIPMGGITVNSLATPKLSPEWEAILNARSKNVLISFGSMAKSSMMSNEMKQSLIEVFKSMPDVTFIWKYEEPTEMTKDLKNVHLVAWTPQDSLLADSRLSLFVTHGGLGSTTEIAYRGKVSIMIPLYGDQTRNAKMLARHGGAVILEKNDLLHWELIAETIRKVLHNENYQKKATLLSEILRSQPISPRKLFVSHFEFAARFGTLPQTEAYGRHLNLFQYYLVDVVFFIVFVVIAVFCMICLCLRKSYRLCCSQNKVKTE